MNYEKIIKEIYAKEVDKPLSAASLKIYINYLKRNNSLESLKEKIKNENKSYIKYNEIIKKIYFRRFSKECPAAELEKCKNSFDEGKSLNEVLRSLADLPSKNEEHQSIITGEEEEAQPFKKENLNILYCSLIRDKEKLLEKWIKNIRKIKALRPKWNISLSCYENDSKDDTKKVLQNLDYSFLNSHKITVENTGKKLHFNKERERVKNLAAYRNLCINQYADLDSIDRIIMHDVDCLYEPEDAVKLIEESLNWDVLSTISYPTEISNIVYDSWATRKNKSDKHWNHKDVIFPGINRVYSTGNGFVCYNPEPFKKGMGFGYLINDSHDCENVVICENYLNMGYDRIAFHADYKTRHIILPRNKIKASGFFKIQEAREEKSIWASKKCCVDFLKQRNENVIIELSHCSDINSIKVFECLGDKLKPLSYKIEKIDNDSFTINIPLSNTKKICIDSPRIIPYVKKKGYNLIFKINSFQIGKEPLDINVLSDLY